MDPSSATAMANSLLNISASTGADVTFADSSFEAYANSALVTVDFQKTITALEDSVAILQDHAVASSEATQRIEARIDDLASAVDALGQSPDWATMALAIVAPLTAYMFLDRFVLRR